MLELCVNSFLQNKKHTALAKTFPNHGQVRSQKSVVAASKEWEQFALRLVSSSIASPDDFESLSGKEDFLLAFADVIQQTCFLGDFQAYLKE